MTKRLLLLAKRLLLLLLRLLRLAQELLTLIAAMQPIAAATSSVKAAMQLRNVFEVRAPLAGRRGSALHRRWPCRKASQ